MTAKLIEYNGKKQSLKDWAIETGLDSKCLTYRLQQGWTVERALTTPSDTQLNKRIGSGREIKVGITASFLKIWKESGQAEFEKQLAAAFAKDALKTLQAFQFLLPKYETEAETSSKFAAIQINNVIDPKDFSSKYEPIGD